MALQLGAGDGFNRDLGDQDGKLTFAEAVVQVNGQKLIGPERRPLKSDRPVGDVTIGDLPLRNMDSMGHKVEQYADVIVNHKLNVTQDFLDNTLYRLCAQEKYSELPPPFNMKEEPKVLLGRSSHRGCLQISF